ncbi:MAG: hypothetical protein M2R45_00694 [Verrucomicrobia subdivision 3 bacterium]|nr:hypothetical protein [Limisphaerales bacterium]MCS1414422.1 hypothetical protein [Limisphaerales bacterium]
MSPRVAESLSGKGILCSMVLEVKGGENVNLNIVCQLLGVLEHEDADMVGLILMRKLKPQQATTFSREMAMAKDMKDKRCPACTS